MRQAETDQGIKDGMTTAEQSELVRLRREKRRLEMENEIPRRAAQCPEHRTLAHQRRAALRDDLLDRTHL